MEAMTQEQRKKTKEALSRCGQKNWVYGPCNWGWKRAIQLAEEYYREADPGLRGSILQLRYMERRRREEVMDKLNIGYSTYQKAHDDLLSTIAVFAAHTTVSCDAKMPPDRPVRGHSCAQCFFSGVSQCWWQEAQLPPQPSPFQPPCREIHTTASANRTASTSKVMIPRTVIIKKASLSEEFQPQYTPSAPGEQPESAVGSNFFRKTKIWACIWTNGVV